VRAYPAQEAYGFIFVFTGDPAKAESTPMPDLPAYHDPEYRVRVLDRRIDCHYTFMHENLMDMNHQFLHRKLMGKIRATLHDVRSGDDWVEAKYTFARLGGRQSVGEKMMVGGGRPKHAGRDKDGMIIRTEYPYQRLTFTVPGADKPALDLWNIYMPVDAEQRTNQTYGLMMIRKPPKMTMKALPGRPSLIDAFWPMIVWFTESIFAEDQDIVEQEQAAFDAKGRDENNEVFPPIIALRDLLRRGGVPMDDAARTTTLLQAAE
jgi:phenylpropionate dioxygenase-like ring-hydroxylating dioxygenase large terminal subunit